MSEPMNMSSGLDDGTATPDAGHEPGLADAVSTLESVIGGGDGGETTTEPSRSGSAPAQEAPASPATPGRWDKVRDFQTQAQRSHRERQQARAREIQEYREREARWQEQMERQTALNQQLLQHLRGLNPEKAAEIPDPLDPGFGAWLTKQIETQNAAALKPVLDHFQQQEAIRQQQEEQAQREAYVEETRASIETGFRQEMEEYQQASEFAYGAEQRVQTWVEIRTGVYQRAGYPPEMANKRALLEIFHHSEWARSQGMNGVAAVDALVCADMEAMGLDPVDPGGDLTGAYQPAPASPGRPAPRAMTPPSETERLAAVQNRARGAGNGGPRVSARAQTEVSELEELHRMGETNHRTLMAAALKDHNGNMGRAAQALNDLAHRRATAGR